MWTDQQRRVADLSFRQAAAAVEESFTKISESTQL